jgi:hypothetical protein
MIKVLWFPHSGEPQIVQRPSLPFEESLYLGPGFVLLYNLDRYSPNASLKKFGRIVSNIPGDAILICEDVTTGKPIDVPSDILQQFPRILKADEEQRIRFVEEMENMAGVIRI